MLRVYKLLYITAFFFLFITATKIIAIFIKNKDFAYFFHKKINISWKTVASHIIIVQPPARHMKKIEKKLQIFSISQK